MKVLIVGANGKVARRSLQHFKNSSKHDAVAMIRKEEQASELKELGAAETVIADLEGDISEAFKGIDAVVFAAGSGPSTGADKTVLIDLWGAMKTIDEAKKNGIKRFVMVSAINVDEPEAAPEKMRHYVVAKKLADDHLKASGLDYTIVRPGSLNNEDPIGKILLEEKIGHRNAEITRADVGHIVFETLDKTNTYGKIFEVLNGETPIEDAIKKV
ncbi:NAD-dependent dehydratase [Salipaludibacillus neizhouensis]|uniref:NAD-dependent dehydratase n=1 Tax=Salipaludibacillus neizhouensis TaxID=885475 RepID=A0A3A9JXP7_9BACI|nr:SDR family oxidoreductase [Salipaludibacillus neizhouensis]RKL65664.1 NAD-dependent dehydratase [Salipaludibacillus neizhouensis]